MIVLPCTCQFKMHALNYEPKEERFLTDLINKYGYYKKVTLVTTQKSYKVPVAFILCHGIKGNELESYGFDRWDDAKDGHPPAQQLITQQDIDTPAKPHDITKKQGVIQ